MTFQQYLEHFERILNAPKQEAPYDDAEYFNYTKLNWSRLNRWLKKGEIKPEIQAKIQQIKVPQKWVVITEPWCGDAAQILPFIKLMSDVNEHIQLDLELRDSEPFRIESYLTNGGKSIPKIIVFDEKDREIGVWGPRPEAAQSFFLELKSKDLPFEDLKVELQNWYNNDKGAEIQNEFTAICCGTLS